VRPVPSFYLKRGNEDYLILGITKSRERAIAEVLMIDDVVSRQK